MNVSLSWAFLFQCMIASSKVRYNTTILGLCVSANEKTNYICIRFLIICSYLYDRTVDGVTSTRSRKMKRFSFFRIDMWVSPTNGLCWNAIKIYSVISKDSTHNKYVTREYLYSSMFLYHKHYMHVDFKWWSEIREIVTKHPWNSDFNIYIR